MPGPQLDPVKVAQFQKGFTGQDQQPQPSPSPQALAGALAQRYMQNVNGQGPGPSAASPAPMNPHVAKMQEAADAAKQAYMAKYGVDENGDPIAQK